MKINNKHLINVVSGEEVRQIQFKDGFEFTFDPDARPVVTEASGDEEHVSVTLKLGYTTQEKIEKISDQFADRLEPVASFVKFKTSFEPKFVEITEEQ